jgi:hypothetical protein
MFKVENILTASGASLAQFTLETRTLQVTKDFLLYSIGCWSWSNDLRSSVSTTILSVSAGYLNATKTFSDFHANEFLQGFRLDATKAGLYIDRRTALFLQRSLLQERKTDLQLILWSFVSLLSITIKLKTMHRLLQCHAKFAQAWLQGWGLRLQHNSDFLKLAIDRPVYIADMTHEASPCLSGEWLGTLQGRLVLCPCRFHFTTYFACVILASPALP